MTSAAHPDDLLGAYATGACTPEETALVATHAAGCDSCVAEIEKLTEAARWIGTTHADAPLPQGLKSRVLAAAFQARPAREPATGAHLDPYVLQVTAFGRLIAELDEPQWLLPTGPYATVREMVRHLTANDGLVAADLGVSAEPQGWQAQADGLLRTVAGADTRILARPVRLAGGGDLRAPLRDALTQRAFETWIHADDIRSALRLPCEAPPPEHIARIVAFGLRLLPAAMDAAGRAHPHRCARLVLTGPGGGEHVVALSARRPADGDPAAEIVLPVVRFCRLMAGRTAVAASDVRITGDYGVAADVLAVAATLGCD